MKWNSVMLQLIALFFFINIYCHYEREALLSPFCPRNYPESPLPLLEIPEYAYGINQSY